MAFALCLAVMWGSGACNSSEETITQASQLTNISANVKLTTVDAGYAGGNEMWAASFPRGALNPTGALVSYNSTESYNSGSAGGSLVGVSVTTDNGQSWALHNTDDANFFPVLTMTSGAPSLHCTLADGGTANCGWHGDSSATGTGIDHQVVVASILWGDDGTTDIAVALSTNDAARFVGAQHGLVLSDANSGGGLLGVNVDAPVVASEGNGVVWAWWWGGPQPGSSFIRRFTTTGGKLNAPNPPIKIGPKLMVPNPLHATMAVQTNPANGLDTIELVYSNYFMGGYWNCANPSNQTTVDVTWWLSVSSDSGNTWSHRVILHDPYWPKCLTSDSVNGLNRIRAPVAFDGVSHRLMIAVGGVSTFDTAGNCVGTRTVAIQWPNSQNQDAVDAWNPVCNPALCPPGNPGPCLMPHSAMPVGETFCNQYGAEIATMPFGSGSEAAYGWFDTRDSTSPPNPPVGPTCPLPTDLQADFYGGSLVPGASTQVYWTVSPITPLGPGVPWTWSCGNCGNTPWGDYQGMTAANGQFFAFWADARNLGSTQIYTASFGP